MCANPLYQIDKEWAVQLVGLCRIVQGYWLNYNALDEEKRESHKEKKLLLRFEKYLEHTTGSTFEPKK